MSQTASYGAPMQHRTTGKSLYMHVYTSCTQNYFNAQSKTIDHGLTLIFRLENASGYK